MQPSMIAAIRRERKLGYSKERIAAERGISVAEVTAALTVSPEMAAERRYDLRGEMRRLLDKCKTEKERSVVRANFADVL